MILIPCPYCGPRAQTEFSYGGDASVVRPQWHAAPQAGTAPETGPETRPKTEPKTGPKTGQQSAQDSDEASMRQWLDHIYLRENSRGPHLEWWQHHSGCRAWIKVRRDTATHEVLGAWRVTGTLRDLRRRAQGWSNLVLLPRRRHRRGHVDGSLDREPPRPSRRLHDRLRTEASRESARATQLERSSRREERQDGN